jgi:hypothetical protein
MTPPVDVEGHPRQVTRFDNSLFFRSVACAFPGNGNGGSAHAHGREKLPAR